MASLQSKIDEYLRLDKNQATLEEARVIIQRNNQEELENLFGARLEFGTAGLRAAMGAGFARMNQLTVIQTSQGLAAYLMKTVLGAKEMGVVVGHDHRHNSLEFAQLTAAVFLQFGFRVYYFPDLVHTPMVPFTVTSKQACAGVMITASHNPKNDNGYKVYWGNGSQIIPPHDKGIAASILENLEPITWDLSLWKTHSNCISPTDAIDDYFNDLATLSRFKQNKVDSFVEICYTAMHGVGLPFAKRAMETFGLNEFHPVPEQMSPDPDFKTVSFPNPEEKGALDLAIKYATANGCKIIVANDPDADRFAAAEYLEGLEKWHVFTGNEIGILLASFILETSTKDLSQTAVLTTTVSSHMLEALAKFKGVQFYDTLTGFKWLGNKAFDLKKQGVNTVFAFEEALGYMCNGNIKDKDGISALAIFCESANQLYSQKISVYDHLTSLYQKYGYWVTNNSYYFCYKKEIIERIFNKIRFGENPLYDAESLFPYKLKYPLTIGGFKIVSVRDLTIGYDSSTPGNKPDLPVSTSTQMITFRLENKCVITLRTSGTEPKIKYYTELPCDRIEDGTVLLQTIVDAMSLELLEPKKNNLT